MWDKSKILVLQNGCISRQIADAQPMPCNHQPSLRLVLSCLCELKPCLDISGISLQHLANRTGLFSESLHPLVKKDISTQCGMAPKSQVNQAKLDMQKHSWEFPFNSIHKSSSVQNSLLARKTIFLIPAWPGDHIKSTYPSIHKAKTPLRDQ